MRDVRELIQKVTESEGMLHNEEWVSQVAEVYTNLDPLDLGIQLKGALGDPMLIAMALRKVVVKYPAVVVGKILLKEQMYPELTRDEMCSILEQVFPNENVNRAVSILYPLEIMVDAKQIWNDTGIDIFPNEKIKIEYAGGRWCINPSMGFCNAGGIPIIGKPGYTLTGHYEGCLVGRIGDPQNMAFYVGMGFSGSCLGTENGSRLYLAANDDVNCRYGRGYMDNSGSITVVITKELI